VIEVTRFDVGNACGDEYNCGMGESETGDYVEFSDYEKLQAKLSTATAQLVEKDKAILKIHKDLGCELRDPNGTIWEHAAAVQKKLDAATACLVRIRDDGEEMSSDRARVTLKEIGHE